VVLHTSFVVDALVPSQARHPECQAFLRTLGDSQATVLFNRFLEPELWEATYRIALKELHPRKRALEVRHDRRTLRRARDLRDRVEAAWRSALSLIDSVAIDLFEVQGGVPRLMGHGLTSYDAIHAATAVYADVSALITLDYHFALVPERELQLWVPSSRLRPCRERRRGRK
jgi:predicted nucleic acid-binding protein